MSVHPDTSKTVQRVGIVSAVLNISLAILKVLAGILGNSRAVLADGVHSISDLATDVAVIVGVRYWSRPADEDHPYGHQRIETIVTLAIGVVLAGAAAGILWDSVTRLEGDAPELPRGIALVAALVSLVSKEILYRWNMAKARETNSSALRANAWHHRSDAFSSIPAAVAVVGVWIDPALWVLDLVGAVIISVLIFHAAWKISWPALQQLSDRGACTETVKHLTSLAMEVEGVREIHKTRTRYVGSGLSVDLHVQVNPDASVKEGHDISGAVIDKLMKEGPDVVDVLTHLEPYEGESDK